MNDSVTLLPESIRSGIGRGLLLTCVLACTGCIPVPHFYKRVPKITGTIHRGAEPEGGVPAFIMKGDAERGCVDIVHETRTDGEGRFSFRGKQGFVPFWIIMGHSISTWGICIGETGAEQVAWGARRYQPGPPSAPRRVTIDCDLDRPELCTLAIVGDGGREYQTRTGPRARDTSSVPERKPE